MKFLKFLFLLIAWNVSMQATAQGHTDNTMAMEAVKKATNTTFLNAYADALQLQYKSQRAEAIKFAEKAGLPIEGTYNNSKFSLQKMDRDGKLLYYTTYNRLCAQTMKTDQLYSGGSSALNLTGQGLTLGIWDGGKPQIDHPELQGRCNYKDTNNEIDQHATHVSGTMIASGLNPQAKGMAYQANLTAYDFNEDLPEIAANAVDLLLSNHSYGPLTSWIYSEDMGGWIWIGGANNMEDPTNGAYREESSAMDEILFHAPYYLTVWAAGNERDNTGPSPGEPYFVYEGEDNNGAPIYSESNIQRKHNIYDCISGNSVSKNVLTVGAARSVGSAIDNWFMSDFSSWGPTDDGRIKPDVMGRGVEVFSTFPNSDYGPLDGTSMASPSVTGSLALLQQHYHNLEGSYLYSATLKAVVIHTADQFLGRVGPGYETGWGMVNTMAAADHISSSLANPAGQNRMYLNENITNSASKDYKFNYNGSGPIKATMVWTDPAGTASTGTVNPTDLRLVNDLDIRLIRLANNQTYNPWVLNPAAPNAQASKGDNFRDNVEQVYEENLPAGEYVIRVSHKRSLVNGTQTFALMLTQGDGSLAAFAVSPNPIYLDASGKLVGPGPQNEIAVSSTSPWQVSYESNNPQARLNINGLTTSVKSADVGEKSMTVSASKNNRPFDLHGKLIFTDANDPFVVLGIVDVTQYKTEEPVIYVVHEKNNIEVADTFRISESNGEIFNLKIYSNTIWQVEKSTFDNWVKFDENPHSGDMDGSLQITVDPNKLGLNRYGQLTIKYSNGYGLNARFTISQPDTLCYLNAPTSLTINANAGTYNNLFTIYSDQQWTLTTPGEWCKVLPGQNSGNPGATVISLILTENASTTDRPGDIVVTTKSGSCETITKTIKVRQLLRPREADQSNAAIIYPNPASAAFQLDLETTEGERLSIDMYNATGQLVKGLEKNRTTIGAFSNHYQIDDLPAGIYIIRFRTDTINGSKKLLIAR